jgi:hypothetical protein
MTIKTCYITGEPVSTRDTYYFGTEAHVILRLTQPSFAHFVIRAGKDKMHSQIMADIKQVCDDIDAFKAKELQSGSLEPDNTDTYIDAAIDRAIRAEKLDDRMANLLTQKCESGIRILRLMKKDFDQTGKLS